MIFVNTPPKPRDQLWLRWEVLKLVQAAWRHEYYGGGEHGPRLASFLFGSAGGLHPRAVLTGVIFL
jgi:hypothetical protein